MIIPQVNTHTAITPFTKFTLVRKKTNTRLFRISPHTEVILMSRICLYRSYDVLWDMAQRVIYVCNYDGCSTDTIVGMMQHQEERGHPNAGWYQEVIED